MRNLTEQGKKLLNSIKYLSEGETHLDMFRRVANAFSDSDSSRKGHADRLYDYMSRFWFMPATPILTNAGKVKGLPISCFLNYADDNMENLLETLYETSHLSYAGGGVATNWSAVRGIGSSINTGGETSGVIPFIKIENDMSIAISQGGSLRRGSIATYLHVSHPEIVEFINLRHPSGGELSRKCFNIHHGVVITDEFMRAVENNLEWKFYQPHNKTPAGSINARELWFSLLTLRLEQGEPYLLFIDSVNRQLPIPYQLTGRTVNQSNLCSEITLHTSPEETAVCCLSSLNLEYYDEWRDNQLFFEDVLIFLSNVMKSFVVNAPKQLSKAVRSALYENSVGLGVMGLHSYFLSKMIAFDSVEARTINHDIFENIAFKVNQLNYSLGRNRGTPTVCDEAGVMNHFTHVTAIAPTASISIIAGGTSPCVEPLVANAYTSKTLAGSIPVKNKFLFPILQRYNKDDEETWSSIFENQGSVQHLSFLSDSEKVVFKTAFEIDQNVIVDLAAARQPFIDQSQSINLFLRPDITKKELHLIHFTAWQKQLKSLYYCRSQSLHQVENLCSQNGCTVCQ